MEILQVEFRYSGDYQLRVYDAVGKMLKFRDYTSVSGTVDLDLSELDQGIYLINIEGNKGIETMKYIRNSGRFTGIST